MASKKKEDKTTEYAMLAVLGILVFTASFYFFSSQLREHDVKGLKVLSKGDPYDEMASVFSPNRLVLKQYLYPGEDERNSYVGLVAAEIAGAFSYFNKSLYSYGFVPDEKNESMRLINCVNNTDFCSNEKVVVKLDSCNCLKIENGIVNVLYDKERLKEDALRVQLRGVFGGVLMAENSTITN
ncbi:MAG: hypothetical protein ABIG96_02585 [Candidatus Micrarchaeota archaeon]